MRRINVVLLKEQSTFLDSFKLQNNISSNDKAINMIIDIYKKISSEVTKKIEDDENLLNELNKLGVS